MIRRCSIIIIFPFMQRIHLPILGKGIKGIGLLKIEGEGLVNNLLTLLFDR